MRKLACLVLTLLLFGLLPAKAADSTYVPEDSPGTAAPLQIGTIPPYEGELIAKSAILMDAITGKILFEKDPHTQRPPASIAKIMTMILVMEALERGELTLDDVMIASTRAKETGGTQIFLDAGDEITVEQAMIGMAVESANDAAIVVAEHLGGSVEGFVEMMNRRARELGMENTHYANPHGLHDEEHYTTAYDMAVLVRYAMQNGDFRAIVSTPSYTCPSTKKMDERTLYNTNRFLNPKEKNKKYNWSAVTGVKTGKNGETLLVIDGNEYPVTAVTAVS